MIQKTWATLNPGDRVLGRNAGTVTDITPAHNGDGLLVRYQDGTAKNVREPGETVCVLGVFAGQGLECERPGSRVDARSGPDLNRSGYRPGGSP